MLKRENEASQIWLRRDRIFLEGDVWFFHTREGIEVGPYEGMIEACEDAEMLTLLLYGASGADACAVIGDFLPETPALLMGGGGRPQAVGEGPPGGNVYVLRPDAV